MPTPTRVGLIGLSARPAWANSAHLPFFTSSPKYTITALSNSSLPSARAAISHHHLPSTTKAYASAKDLADDPEVDLVVVSVQAAKHYDLLKPALLAGKDVSCEWPLGKNLREAEELAQMAAKEKVQSVVNLQGRQGPAMKALKGIIASGRIGRVVSTSIVAHVGPMGILKVQDGNRYMIDAETGGNFWTIYAGHLLDSFTNALGHFSSLSAILANQHTADILSDFGTIKQANVPKDVPDHFLIQGTLAGKHAGAVASISVRVGELFPNTPSFSWRVYGEKGQVLITSDAVMFQFGDPALVLKVFENKSAKVEVVKLVDEKQRELGMVSRNVARTFEAFAGGVEGTYPTFGDALVIHRMLDAMERSSKSGERVSYEY